MVHFLMRALSILFVVFLWLLPTPCAAIPTVQAVQRQALLSAGLGDAAPQSWQQRAAWQAALPQLRVTVQKDHDEQLRLTNSDNTSLSGGNVTIGPNKLDLLQDFDSELRFQVSATWDLDRLVFNRDQILISQERRRRNEEKWQLLARVNQLYYDYQAAQRPRKARLMAELDALTDGWFSDQLDRGSASPRVSK